MVSLLGPLQIRVTEMQWRPDKAEIKDWLEAIIYSFLLLLRKCIYPGEAVKRLKEKYLFECLHWIFMAEFPVNLHKWL